MAGNVAIGIDSFEEIIKGNILYVKVLLEEQQNGAYS